MSLGTLRPGYDQYHVDEQRELRLLDIAFIIANAIRKDVMNRWQLISSISGGRRGSRTNRHICLF